MDATEFDRFAKSLSRVGTRRTTFGRLAALLAIATGPTLADQDEATAGLRHRRQVRHRHNRDNRKGKRKDNTRNNRPPGAGASRVDCSNRPDGTPCDNIGRLWQLRCCNGVCPEDRDCVPQGEYLSGRSCTTNDDCFDYRGACCSQLVACDNAFEQLCECLPAFEGEPCVADQNCGFRACVCGLCR